VVCDQLVRFFPELFDYAFTAQMEQALDQVAGGRQRRQGVLEDFWAGFEPTLEKARAEMPTVVVQSNGVAQGGKAPAVPLEEACPECGAALVRREGRFGPFIGCSAYPKCKYTRQVVAQSAGVCPECGGQLVTKKGRFGPFVGCANYPRCTYVQR
jgi:DNA topoisomerase-1